MKPTVTTDNKLFIYAFTGVLLLIAAMGFTLTNFSNIAMFELSYSLIAGILSFSAISLLVKAIRNDRHRLDRQV